MLPQPLGSLKLMLKFFLITNIQERKLNLGNFSMRSSAYEPISFKLGMMINMTKLYDYIPVGMTLIVTQYYRLTRQLELVRSFHHIYGGTK